MDYRITITFNVPEDFMSEDEEIIRRGIADILDCQLAENVKIRIEDKECIRQNDNLDKRDKDMKKCLKCGNHYPAGSVSKGECVNCMISRIANK